MLVGEEMPDKDNPKYKERRERELAAGRKFARATRLDRMAVWVQTIANRHKTLFLVVVFGFVVSCFGLNIYRMAQAYEAKPSNRSAIEQQEQHLSNRRKPMQDTLKPIQSLSVKKDNNHKKGAER